VEGSISRTITAARAGLKFGSVKARSVSAVNDEMLRIIGLPKKTLQEVVFVMQGAIENVLFEDPAERKKKLQGLFGVENAEPLRVLLQREIAEIGNLPSSEQLQQQQTQLDTVIDPKLRELTAQHAELNKSVVGVDCIALHLIIDDYTTHQANTAKHEQLQRQGAELTVQIEKLKQVVQTDSSELQQQTEKLKQLQQSVEDHRVQLRELGSKRTIADTARRLHEESVQLTQILSTPAPVAPTDAPAVASLTEAVALSEQELMPKAAFVRAFDGCVDDNVVCPTCGQTVADAQQRVAAIRLELSAAKAQIDAARVILKESEAALRAYERAKTEYDAGLVYAKARLNDIQAHVVSLGDIVPVDPQTYDQLRASVAAYEQNERLLAQRQKETTSRQTQLATFTGQLDAVHAAISEIAKDGEMAPSNDDYTYAKQALDAVRTMREQLANIDGQLSQLQTQRATVLAEVERLKEQLAKVGNVLNYRGMCERARTVLHYDCLPLLVTQAYLTGLNIRLNEYLRTFNVPFSCAIKDDLSVVCTMPDGHEHTADRLSGGQRVVLSISFRFAVYSLFASNLGFMVLDEPTTMLDDDRVMAVTALLQQVRQYAHRTGMQLIVVTHEPELATAFDHEVRL
jgi:DNA repair exonuclease SbcCD ATPase subunit